MVPLCSLSEQEVVVERLSVILSTIDAMEADDSTISYSKPMPFANRF